MKRKILFFKTISILGSACLAFLFAELVVRDYKQGLRNLILDRQGGLVEPHARGLFAYDDYLGWVPRENVSVPKWGTTVNTVDDGIRSNGAFTPKRDGIKILAIGDSFTFGDELPDDSTWPALLERLINVKVLNAGVSSYGFDQMILRAEQLVAKYQPNIVIINFIPEDIRRCAEYVRHGVPKPYYVIEGDALVVKNQPVPQEARPRLDGLRSVFGHSHLAHKIMSRYFPEYWLKNSVSDIRTVLNANKGVARRLLENFAKSLPPETRIIVLLSGGNNLGQAQKEDVTPLLYYWAQAVPRLEIHDLLSSLLELKKDKPQEFNSLYLSTESAHMSVKGNAVVAKLLAEVIVKGKP